MAAGGRRYGNEAVTLRQTLVVAVLLHLLLGALAERWPGLLGSQPVFAEPQHRPLRFRFVDVPESELPAEPPATDALSDRDRRARDASDREGAETPYAEGNTRQEVLRGVASAASPRPALPPTEAAPGSSQPDPREPATGREPVPPVAPETAPGAVAAGSPRLTEALARLESFVRPEAYHNPEGGVGGPRGVVSFDTRGYDLGPYIREILTIIERNWKSNIPPAARLPGMRGATFVRLSIERQHSAAGSEVARILVHRTWSSGKPSFDQAALFALEISDPLPPLPDYFPFQRLDGRIGFLYNLDPDEVTFPSGP